MQSAQLIITVARKGNSKAFVAFADTGTSATLISTKVTKFGEKVENKNGSTKWGWRIHQQKNVK